MFPKISRPLLLNVTFQYACSWNLVSVYGTLEIQTFSPASSSIGENFLEYVSRDIYTSDFRSQRFTTIGSFIRASSLALGSMEFFPWTICHRVPNRLSHRLGPLQFKPFPPSLKRFDVPKVWLRAFSKCIEIYEPMRDISGPLATGAHRSGQRLMFRSSAEFRAGSVKNVPAPPYPLFANLLEILTSDKAYYFEDRFAYGWSNWSRTVT